MPYQKVASMNAFKNDNVDPNSKKPAFSNSKCRIETAIPAGEYSLGVWHSDRGLSISLQEEVGGTSYSTDNPLPRGDLDDDILT